MQGNEWLQSEHRPKRVIEAYFTPLGELRGCEIHHLSHIECIRRFDISYEFAGKTAIVWVVTHDRRVDYSLALHLATSVALGKVVRHTVSTEKLVGFFTRKKKGK